jgi:hypothetical protein
MELSERCSLRKQSTQSKNLEQEISAAVIIISEETLAAVVQNSHCGLQMFMYADGTHIENVCT